MPNYYTTSIGSALTIPSSYNRDNLAKDGKAVNNASASGGVLSFYGYASNSGSSTITYQTADTIPKVAKELNDALTDFYKALFTYQVWITSPSPSVTNVPQSVALTLPGYDYTKTINGGSNISNASDALTQLVTKHNLVREQMVKLQYLIDQSDNSFSTRQTDIGRLQKDLDQKLRDLQGGSLSAFADMPEQLNTSMYTGLFWSVLAVSAVFVAFTQLG